MEDKFEIIEKYLNNELSVREQVKFEEELRSDPQLMKEYVLRKNINEAVIEDDVINLRESLHEILDERSIAKKPVKRLYLYSAVAAVMILLIVISNNFFFTSRSLNCTDAYDKYYSTYPAIMSFRSPVDQSEIESIFYDAFNCYDVGNFEDASELFKEIIQKDSNNYMGQFYLGVCQLETGDLHNAEVYFTDLVQKNDHIFWEQSYWYLTMVYLKENKIDNARNTLNKIVREDMANTSEAKSLLKSLK